MIRRVIKADNHCLFNAITYALESQCITMSTFLRDLVGQHVLADPTNFNHATLGMAP